MHRRFLFPLAAGIVGLVAISPVLASEPSPAAAGSGPAKSTTSSSMGATSSTMTDGDAGAGSDTDPAPDSGSGAEAGSSSSTATTATTGPTATTAPGSGSGSSSTNCAPPDTEQGPAPQVGEAPQNYAAGEAGNVDVERLSATELRIAKATASDGWTQQVTSPSGPRVNVRFNRPGQSPSLIRFAASMDQAGKMIHVRVTSCG